MKATRALQAGSDRRKMSDTTQALEQRPGDTARLTSIDCSRRAGERHDIYPSRTKLRLEIIFLALVWVLVVALIWHGMHLTLWRDGSIGPGAYPLATLAGLLGLTTALLVKALRVRQLRLYSPFQPGLEDDIRLRQLADVMAQRTAIPIRVVTKDGEGRFSSLWKGLSDARRGDVLTVVSSDMTMLPNFHAAAVCGSRLEPIGGLFFDPDVLVVRPDSDWEKPADIKGNDDPVRMGFGHHVDVDHAIDQWLSATDAFAFTPTYSNDIPGLLASLHEGNIDALVLSLSQCQQALAAGDVRCVGIFSGQQPPETIQDAASFSRDGSRVFSGRWAALMVSADMAEDKKTALAEAFRQAMQDFTPVTAKDDSAREWRFLSDMEMKDIIETQKRCLALFAPERQAMPTGKTAGLVTAIAGLAVFPAVMSAFGFPLTAFAYLAGLMLLLCPKLTASRVLVSLAVAGLVTACVYLVFTRIFGVVMPDPSLLEGIAWSNF